MPKKITQFIVLSTFLFGSWAASSQAQEANHLAAAKANSRHGFATPLTLPSQASARANVASFLADEGYSPETLASLELSSDNFNSAVGQRYLRLQQVIGGKRVHGSFVKAVADEDGALLTVIDRLASVAAAPPRSAAVSASQALQTAIAANHPGGPSGATARGKSGQVTRFNNSGFFHADPWAEAVIISDRQGRLEEGYLVETWGEEDNQLYHTLVDGNGLIVDIELRTVNDSYNIFGVDPNSTPQMIVPGPGTGNAESPAGWLAGSQTTLVIAGNNVRAYLDRDRNNVPDGGGSAVSDGNFLTAADLGSDPTTAANQEVAVQNLFYFNNLIHDVLYRHGFNEAARNFQEDNFGNGGLGSDSVNAEAQDGNGLNNANFATPNDGSNPRMQMFLWNETSPRRDGDLDSDIIWHEYGHGLTWRMIGSMSGSISGAIGEGMSDVLAILINNNDVVGEYSTGDPLGIRSAAYTNYPRTLADFSGSSVHFDGEIYAATIWRLWEKFQADNIPLTTLLDYLVNGMNHTAPGPGYEDMRDGILAAVGSNDDHRCLVWEAFSEFGIGEGATIVIRANGNPRNRIQPRPSSTIPEGECNGGTGGNQAPIADAGEDQLHVVASETDTFLVTLDGRASSDPDGSILSYSWTGTVNSAAATFQTTLGVGVHVFELVVTDNEGLASAPASVQITISAPGAAPDLVSCTPNQGSRGQRLTVTLTGSGFSAGDTISFGPRINIQSATLVSSNEIQAQIRIHRQAPTGLRDISVTNAAGQGSGGAGCFTVN